MRTLKSLTTVKTILIAMMILTNIGLSANRDLEAYHPQSQFYSPLAGSPVSVEIEQTSEQIIINLTVEELESTPTGNTIQWQIRGEGIIGQDGMPDLPAICRYVAVPDVGRLSVTFTVENTVRVTAPQPVNYTINAGVNDLTPSSHHTLSTESENGLYPTDVVRMSEPMIMRGVRMVALTFFPLQWDDANEEYVENLYFRVDITTLPDRGINEVRDIIRQPSTGFDISIDKLLVNPPLRDQGSENHPPGGYLVVADENAPEAVQEFIDWKRHVGHRVDLLSIEGQFIEQNDLREMIQDIYDETGFEFLVFMGTDDADPPLHIPMDRDFYDIFYAQLEGDDILPDVAVGTFNCITEDNFICAIRRSISYQYMPYMENTNWFTRAGIGVGACSVPNDLSPSYTGKWVTEVLSRTQFEEISTSYYADNGVDDPSRMIEGLYNDRANFILVRAHLWDLEVDDIAAGPVYPFQFLCSSGTISPPNNGSFNWVFRQGTPEDMKGASAGFGHQSSPRTNVANALAGGLAESMFMFDIGSYGWARNYTVANLARVMVADGLQIMPYYYSHWRYYGDPGQGCWVGVPSEVQALDVEEEISPDATSLMVHVELEEGEDVRNTLVTLSQGGNLMKLAHPNDEGNAVFTWEPDILTNDPVYVTVTGIDLVPQSIEIEIVFEQIYIAMIEYGWEDREDGNNDSVPNPGETGNIVAELMNIGQAEIQSVTVRLGSVSPWLTINREDPVLLREVGPEDDISIEDLSATVRDGCPDGTELWIELDIQHERPDGQNTAGMTFTVEAPSMVITGTDGDLVANEQTDLSIIIGNRGSIDSSPLNAHLVSLVPFAVVVENDGQYPALEVGEEAEQNNGAFVLATDENTIPGSVAWFRLILEGGGVWDSLYFSLTVGEADESDPLGPDSYGYIALSNGDENVVWAEAPEYDWIEICPWLQPDLEGTQIMEAIGDEEDFSELIDIPFPFRYYGEEFDQITVCSNGWIAVGDQEELKNQQNWLLPGFDGAYGMMAVFWDRLHFGRDGDGIYVFHDEEGGRLIIEWNGSVEEDGDPRQNVFQIILFDANRYETPTGDSPILCQYRTVNNVQDQWEANTGASVGISSTDGLDGLTYTYWNEYPASCTWLEAETAILWTTISYAPLASISGRVDRWIDSTAVAGARVQTSNGFQTTTSGDGSYRIVGFEPGQFDLTVSAERYGRVVIEGLEAEEGEAIEQDVILPHTWMIVSADTIVGSFTLSALGGACRFALEIDYAESGLDILDPFSFDPMEGEIERGDEQEIGFSYDADGLLPGDYLISLIIYTNTPQEMLVFPLHLDLRESVSDGNLSPVKYELAEPYPNPFNSSVNVSFVLPVESQTLIIMYDLSGKEVRTIASGLFLAGSHTITLQGDDLSTGIYFLRMEAGDFVQTRRLLLLR